MNNVENIKKAMTEILSHLSSYNYLCIDDFLEQIKFKGDISLIKEQLKKIFRTSREINLTIFEEKQNKFKVARDKHSALMNEFKNFTTNSLNQQLKRVETELNYKNKELSNKTTELNILENEYKFLLGLQKDLESQLTSKYKHSDLTLEEKSKIEEGKNEINSVKKDIKNIREKKKRVQNEIGNLKYNINSNKDKLVVLRNQHNNNSKNLDAAINSMQKTVMNYVEAKRYLKFYLNYQIHEDNKLYIYNFFKYKLELIREPEELQKNLRKFRFKKLEIANRFENSLMNLLSKQDLIKNFYNDFETKNSKEFSKQLDSYYANMIYEFIETYSFNKLYEDYTKEVDLSQ